jgi:hypothetical protein
MRATSLLLGTFALVGAIAFGVNSEAQEAVGGPSVAGQLAHLGPGSQPASQQGASGRAELPRARSLTPVSEGRDRQPFGLPGADGEIREGARGPATGIPIDPGPDEGLEPMIISPEGFQVVPGTAEAGSGPRVAYTVEVEPSVGVDPLSLAAAVEEALHDPRSWANEAALQRVDDIDAASIRVVLAEPATVDELCGRAGLDTGGRFSCWNGTFAALNAMRWGSGASDFDDLTTYRRYLINHEFGHGLGYGHLACEAPGALAPVMMQQTKGTDGCEPNGWPYPGLSPP